MKARAVNLVGFGPLTHRLDEHMGEIDAVETRHADDLIAFADRISQLLDGERVDVGDVAAVLRQLPQQNTFNVEDVTVMAKDVRSEERRVGKEGVRKWGSRWSP